MPGHTLAPLYLCVLAQTAAPPADALPIAAPSAAAPTEPAPLEVPGSSTDIIAPPFDPLRLHTGTADRLNLDDNLAPGRLAETLASLPGVSLRETGGLGGYSSLHIRGLGPAHLLVILDDIPLPSSAIGAIDLGMLSTSDLAEAEVHRGSGPARYETPMGGVVVLRSRPPSDDLRLLAASGIGSESTGVVRGSVATTLGPVRLAVDGSFVGSAGNYLFYDDANTTFSAEDDRVRRRRNNATRQGHAHLELGSDLPGGARLKASGRGAWRLQGVPGVGAAEALASSAEQSEGSGRIAVADVELGDDLLRLGGGVDLVRSERLFSDPRRELGLGLGTTRSRVTQVGVDAQVEILPAIGHSLELTPRFSWVDFNQHEASRTRQGRSQLGVGLEYRAAFFDWLRVVPALRLDSIFDRTDGVRTSETALSPRLGVLVDVGPCQVRGGGGWFHRFPTLSERYGDGLYVSAHPGLAPERGQSGDGSVRCAGSPLGLVDVETLLGAYLTQASELIALRPNSLSSAKAQNLGTSRITGMESSITARHAYGSLRAAYAFTDARDTSGIVGRDGRRHVGVPLHGLDARLSIGPSWLEARYDLRAGFDLVLDENNLVRVPARLRHDLGLRWQIAATGLELSGEIRNLTNSLDETVLLGGERRVVVGVEDFLNYPLPGRTWFVGLTWRHG